MKKLLYSVVVALCLGAVCTMPAYASDIDVTFEAMPLFNESHFMPGDVIDRRIYVRNTSRDKQFVYMRTVNTHSGGMERVIDIDISSRDREYFSGPLVELYDTDSVALGALAAGGERMYVITTRTASNIGNDFQNADTKFGLEVGVVHDGATYGVATDGGGSGSDGRDDVSVQDLFMNTLSRMAGIGDVFAHPDQGVSYGQVSNDTVVDAKGNRHDDGRADVRGTSTHATPTSSEDGTSLFDAAVVHVFSGNILMLFLGIPMLLAALVWYTQGRQNKDYPH